MKYIGSEPYDDSGFEKMGSNVKSDHFGHFYYFLKGCLMDRIFPFVTSFLTFLHLLGVYFRQNKHFFVKIYWKMKNSSFLWNPHVLGIFTKNWGHLFISSFLVLYWFWWSFEKVENFFTLSILWVYIGP